MCSAFRKLDAVCSKIKDGASPEERKTHGFAWYWKNATSWEN